jgi:hypothetical protein
MSYLKEEEIDEGVVYPAYKRKALEHLGGAAVR